MKKVGCSFITSYLEIASGTFGFCTIGIFDRCHLVQIMIIGHLEKNLIAFEQASSYQKAINLDSKKPWILHLTCSIQKTFGALCFIIIRLKEVLEESMSLLSFASKCNLMT